MSFNEYAQFPRELAAARREAGLSQKEIALTLGIKQSYLCALEKGRRPAPSDSLILRMAEAINERTAVSEAFLRAATHDRAMAGVLDQGRALPAARAISRILMAVGDLSAGELDALADYIATTHAAKKHLLALAAKPDRTFLKEVEMK